MAIFFSAATRYKLINFYNVKAWELFDLEKDPNELKSVYSDAEYTDTVKTLKEELAKLRTQYKVPEDTRPVRRAQKKPKQKKQQNNNKSK